MEQLHASPVIVLFIKVTGHWYLTAILRSHDCYYFSFSNENIKPCREENSLGHRTTQFVTTKARLETKSTFVFFFNLDALLPLCKWYGIVWCIRKGINWVNLDKTEPPGCGIITSNNQEYALLVVTLNFNGYGHSPCPLSDYETNWLQTDLTPAKNALLR